MATKHFTEKPAKKKTTKLANKLSKLTPEKFTKEIPDTKVEKDITDNKLHKHEQKETKEHNKLEHKEKNEHKEYLLENPIQPTQGLGWNLTPGAAAPAYAVGQSPIHPKPQKELLKEFSKEIFDHKHFFKETLKDVYEHKLYEGPIDPGGPVEQRLQALEAAVSQSAHFIPQALRPDLSQGSLKQESDVAKKSRARKAKKSVVKSTKGTR
jgi:hypothetical protein